MANPSWYNDNAFRDWPFLQRTLPLDDYVPPGSSSSSSLAVSYHVPHPTIVDFGAIMEIDAEFSEAEDHLIYLHEISRVNDEFTFTFRTTAPSGANYQVEFTRDLNDPEFSISWANASSIVGESLDDLDCGDYPRWSAFLVTGQLTELAELLPDDDSIIYPTGLWTIEPSRVQSLMDSYLRAINLANFPRTLATPSAACNSSSSSESSEEPILIAQCLQGDIKWKEGFNCSIRQDERDNAIIIGAGIGSGEGEPCEEVPLYEGEAPPATSPYLSGGPGCGDVVKTLNGVGGRNLFITVGPGFRAAADTENANTLILSRALDDFAQCLEGEVSSSSVGMSSESSESL